EDGLREPHPFTIASGKDGRVHFVVRALGDYTGKLVAQTVPGMHAEIYGPYGRFERRPAAREVWIAGGVGITPFISWLTDPSAKRFDDVTFFYFFTPGREFPSAELIHRLAEERGVAFVPIPGGPSSREFAGAPRSDRVGRRSRPRHRQLLRPRAAPRRDPRAHPRGGHTGGEPAPRVLRI